MAVPRSTSPSMRRTTSAATTPRGFRPPRRSACSWRCCSFWASAPGWAKPISATGAGAFRSCCRASCSASRSGSGLSLNESPIFQKMKEEGKTSKRPLSEAFGEWRNAKIAILALLGATAGEAVVWYGGQFYALFFLTQTLKVTGVTAQILIVIALALGTPGFVIFRLAVGQDRPQADHPGRLPARGADLSSRSSRRSPTSPIRSSRRRSSAPRSTVIADPAECSFQFKATGTEKFTTSCDIARVRAGQPVGELRPTRMRRPGTTAQVKIGEKSLHRCEPQPGFRQGVAAAAIKAHGYPASADPTRRSTPSMIDGDRSGHPGDLS